MSTGLENILDDKANALKWCDNPKLVTRTVTFLFKKYDVDKSGSLEHGEAVNLIQELHRNTRLPEPTAEDIQTELNAMDTDHNDKISHEELAVFLPKFIKNILATKEEEKTEKVEEKTESEAVTEKTEKIATEEAVENTQAETERTEAASPAQEDEQAEEPAKTEEQPEEQSTEDTPAKEDEKEAPKEEEPAKTEGQTEVEPTTTEDNVDDSSNKEAEEQDEQKESAEQPVETENATEAEEKPQDEAATEEKSEEEAATPTEAKEEEPTEPEPAPAPEREMKQAIWLWDSAAVAEALGEAGLTGPVPEGLDGKALLSGTGDWTEDDREKVDELLGRVALGFMQDEAKEKVPFARPGGSAQRLIYTWDAKTVTEFLNEFSLTGEAPAGLDGKGLLGAEGDWKEEDLDIVFSMLQKVSILFMQDMGN